MPLKQTLAPQHSKIISNAMLLISSMTAPDSSSDINIAEPPCVEFLRQKDVMRSKPGKPIVFNFSHSSQCSVMQTILQILNRFSSTVKPESAVVMHCTF